MPKREISDSGCGFGCLFSILLGGVALAVLIGLFNYNMSFGLVLFSLCIGALIVQVYFMIWRSMGSDDDDSSQYEYVTNESDDEDSSQYEYKPMTYQQYFDECTQLSSAFAGFILKTQNNNGILNDIRKIRGLELIDRSSFGAFNRRIFIMVIHDILKCYKSLGYYSGGDVLCASLLYYSTDKGPYDCLDYPTAVIKQDELCHLGDAVIRVIDTLNVSGFDGETDFMLAGALSHYGHDSSEYLGLLHDLALQIIQKYNLDSDYPQRILESGKAPAQSQVDNKLNINDLVGLEEVKQEVRKFSDFIRVQHLREKEGLKVSPINYHCVFTGNPGTGKTTVARILADVYKDLGILKKGHLVETDRSGLVAEYVGQTAVKTNKIIDSALDGVLFIDEAYSLIYQGAGDYGQEAIATLLKRMEDDRDRLVVILAGYGYEMQQFIESNPGLKSRFNRYFHFSDYSATELWEIFKRNLTKHEYVLDSDAEEKVKQILREAVSQKDVNFGNARFVRNLFEKILENQATRIAGENNPERSVLQRIMLSDVEKITIVN